MGKKALSGFCFSSFSYFTERKKKKKKLDDLLMMHLLSLYVERRCWVS